MTIVTRWGGGKPLSLKHGQVDRFEHAYGHQLPVGKVVVAFWFDLGSIKGNGLENLFYRVESLSMKWGHCCWNWIPFLDYTDWRPSVNFALDLRGAQEWRILLQAGDGPVKDFSAELYIMERIPRF